jgi:hypothetical protein
MCREYARSTPPGVKTVLDKTVFLLPWTWMQTGSNGWKLLESSSFSRLFMKRGLIPVQLFIGFHVSTRHPTQTRG